MLPPSFSPAAANSSFPESINRIEYVMKGLLKFVQFLLKLGSAIIGGSQVDSIDDRKFR